MATPEEMEELVQWLQADTSGETAEALHAFHTEGLQAATSITYDYDYWDKVANELLQLDRSSSAANRLVPLHSAKVMRRWIWAAASVLLALGIGAYLWTANNKHTIPPAVAVSNGEIRSGKDGAILTLADGSKVVLDSLGNGVIALQNGSQAIIRNGELTYHPTGEITGDIVYNTMTTPKGRQFSLLLPDGSRVWLNAASSIRYPTVFAGKERQVEVTGEAYFEVAKNEKIPFRVKLNNKAEVEVLGTHFNVNAYENENTINTTLLEGKVRVKHTTQENGVILKPGQQAQVINAMSVGQNAETVIKVIDNADVDNAMAWKNGLFNFEEAELGEIMRQLERWYDIEVVYEKNIPNISSMGKMTRDVPLNGLLKNLGKMGLRYRLEGRKLIVL